MATGSPIDLPASFNASLRWLRPTDASAWSAYLSLPGVIEHTSWGDISPGALATLIEQYAKQRDAFRWAIVDIEDALLGTVGLNEVSLTHGRAELAYDLSPKHRGRGLATAAAGAIVHWAQGQMNLQRIQATVLDSNAPSIAVLERLDMQREGLLRQYRKVRGEARDFWMYAAIRHR